MDIEDLPDEIIIKIISILGIEHISNIFLACKDFSSICRKEEFWEDLCRIHNYNWKEKGVDVSIREYFKAKFLSIVRSENGTGDLYTWGSTLTHRCSKIPRILRSFLLRNVTETYCGLRCYSAIVDGGEAYVWGSNRCCRLGQEPNCSEIEIPRKLDFGDRRIRSITHGEFSTFFLTNDGLVFACGDNSEGFIDPSEDAEKVISEPKLIEFPDRIIHISAGIKSFGCIDTEGRLYTWGNNMYSQLGHNGTKIIDVKKPKLVEILNDCPVIRISFGERMSLVLSKDRQLISFGEESTEETLKSTTPSSIMKYFEDIKISQISCGLNHSSVIDIYGNCYYWGVSNHRCTIGAWSKEIKKPTKITSFFRCKRDPKYWERSIEKVDELDPEKVRFLSVSCGDYFTIALLYDFEEKDREMRRKVVSWGYGGSGRLGNNSSDNVDIPTEIRFFMPKGVKKCGTLSCHASSGSVITDHAWIPDEEVRNCMDCLRAFLSFRVRRHHCRNCLGIFCGKCTKKKVPILKFGFWGHVRVCERCYIILRKEKDKCGHW